VDKVLTRPEIYRVVNGYIGVSGGYLGDFSYRTHQEFYPYYCGLDIDPQDTPYYGTTRMRFMQVLEGQLPENQAKILRGVLAKYPVESFPESQRADKQQIYHEIKAMIARVERETSLQPPTLTVTNETVQRAIADATVLLEKNGPASAVDRVHTAFHGYLRAVCKQANIQVADDADVNALFKKLRDEHPGLQVDHTRKEDIGRVLSSLGNIVNTLNPLRNKASVAHPNEELLGEDEAMLVVNAVQILLYYLNAKLS
jgi:hypothetical protein